LPDKPESQTAIRSWIWRYGAALLLVAVAFVPTLLLQHLFPYPFLFLFFGAVMASAWFGGTAAGLFAVLLSTAVVAYFFVPPFYSWSIGTTAEAYFAAFVVCALVASWVSSAKKQGEDALRAARNTLEIRVSERTAELMKTQAELAHLARVLSMGELTASLAHEISQPLTAVVTHGHACVEWLSATPPNHEKALQTARRIIEDGTRAGNVVDRIRALFKKEPVVKAWFDLNEAIRELTVFVRDEALRRSVHMQVELTPDLPPVYADRVQLQQVILNLIMNSFDAMAEVTDRPKSLLISSRMTEPASVSVRITDCGTGLDEATLEKIFEPFFTTKPHGIGMGLAISRSIVESHGGRLWAELAPSGGATFHVTLPLEARNPDA
jgi:signal transduction histidine kinase